MRHLKNGKAPGPDGIPNELLKHLPEGVHQAIHIFQVVHLDVDDRNHAQGMEGISNSVPAQQGQQT